MSGKTGPNPLQKDTRAKVGLHQELQMRSAHANHARKPLMWTLPLCRTAEPLPTTDMFPLPNSRNDTEIVLPVMGR